MFIRNSCLLLRTNGISNNYVVFFKKAIFLRNPWQNITKKEIAYLHLSDTSLGEYKLNETVVGYE